MNRWQLSRAGLFNFWYYDEEEFHFADGKLLLRGTNGSGKSVTMQSLIPVLLDGRKSPDRLDPFGSRARRMEDYLLGEKEVTELNERTGYLYLEYHRPETNQYLTTGMGLKAKRQSPLDFWGFVIWDNRQIGKDILLYKTERALNGQPEKIPLTRRELESVIGEGGEVVKTQKEYMELINRHLFGFKSVEDYDDLIKLLIQLRSPKLSKDFRPTVVYEILNESLPSLSDDELRPLSDTIENMDQIKSQLDQIQREDQAVKRLLRPYEQYNQKVRIEKAEGLLQAHRLVVETTKALDILHVKRETSQQTLRELQDKEVQLRQEQGVLEGERVALESHDVFKAEKEKSDLLAKQTENTLMLNTKNDQLARSSSQESQLRGQITELEGKQHSVRGDIRSELEEMDFLAEDAGFLNHEVATAEFEKRVEQEFSFALWKKETHDYQTLLDKVLDSLREEARAREKYQEAEFECGEAKKAWDEAQHQEKKWTELLQEEQSQWVQQLFAWHETNEELGLEEIELQTLAGRIRTYPEKVSLDVLREPLQQAVNRAREAVGREVLLREHQKEQFKNQIREKTKELEAWRTLKDPEPPKHPLTGEARQTLEEQNIPYLPFYAAVEFQEHVPPETRERLESALKEMGILDALIVPERYSFALKHDRILKSNPQILAYTLADYLYPTPVEGVALGADEIDGILRTILVENAGLNDGPGDGLYNGLTILTPEGSYQIGSLTGHAPQEETARYIGKEARRQLRLREIAKLEAELEALEEQRLEVEGQLQLLNQRRAKLEEEYRAFPSEKSIREAYDFLYTAHQNVVNRGNEVQKKDEKLKAVLEAWRAVKALVQELSRTLTLPLDPQSYEKARLAMAKYREGLNSIETLHIRMQSFKNERSAKQEHLENVIEDVDELRGEINLLESERQRLTLRLEHVESRLKELGAEEIRKKIQKVLGRLQSIPREIEDCVENMTNLKRDLNQFAERILEQESDLLRAHTFRFAWVQAFQSEESLQDSFRVSQEDIHSPGPAMDETDLQKNPAAQLEESASEEEIVRKVIKSAEQVLAETNFAEGGRSSALPDRDQLRERINDAFNREMANLVEYRLTQQIKFDEEIPRDAALTEPTPESFTGPSIDKDLPELWQKRWDELRQKRRRLQLVLEYDGKRVNPYYLRAQLEKNMALQRQLLNEKDRELYEEIIMNSVGRIIRGRIQRAEHWVEEMNKLMSERDTSSGLRFRIRWKPRVAEHEDEIDTQDLVELLKSDPRLLKENDMSRITQHFRAKIERAKQQLEIKGYGESLHLIIKEMLDYRKWFEFRLFFQKEGENGRELTDRAFYQFSGGEKAMAMYIPLFSAAYSRYSDARADAPRIISLDEAFAGVDENNIRDMFDLLEKLEFNYIMNSQALWGDYDTISHLAIAELVRPKNAPYVTVIRYNWDGKVRRLLT